MPIELQYGSMHLPSSAAVTLTAAWGARAIDEGGRSFSLVYDRQDSAQLNNPAGLKKIGDSVNANLAKMQKRYGHAVNLGHLGSRDSNTVCLLNEGGVTVLAGCNRSYGYLYLTAFLTEEWPGATDLRHMAVDPPKAKAARKPKAKIKKPAADFYRSAW